MLDTPVMAAGDWRTNGEMIADVARLGYIKGKVLDTTYGQGAFWHPWMPLYLDGPRDPSWDFTDMARYEADYFDTVVFDPPYRLNGSPDLGDFDRRYGIDTRSTWQDRMELIFAGERECIRVLRRGGYLLIKCQDQVCSGQVRWQTDMVTTVATDLGLRKVDLFHFASYRGQPSGRRQVHARRNYSSLIVFLKP